MKLSQNPFIPWWKEAVVYQIYVRSFYDGNGDGIGDLQGIIQKLDYIASLGVDAIYLNPINASPNVDNGYDISDFYAIMDEFGTMDDFKRLIAEAKNRGIRVIMDLVINHTSDQHPWFQKAISEDDQGARDYYLWAEGKNEGPPNRWGSYFGGSAWTYVESVGSYYLHLFSKAQPDLNWKNPALKKEVEEILKFYLDLGVEGFRFDAINHLAKDHSFPEGKEKEKDLFTDFTPYIQNRPEGHVLIRELRQMICQKNPQALVIGETGGISYHNAAQYTAPGREELDFTFHFDYHSVKKDPQSGWVDLMALKKVMGGWQKRPASEGWLPLFYSNHDSSRTVSRLGEDGDHRQASAKMLALLLMTQRGTPFVYFGDEIGMTNAYNYDVEDYDDISVAQRYRDLVLSGLVTREAFLKDLHEKGRDNARTPMQWSGKKYAGFSQVKPWIKLNDRYKTINVALEEQDSQSVLWAYRELIRLRKAHQGLIHGSFHFVNYAHRHVMAYERRYQNRCYLVVANFHPEETMFKRPKYLKSVVLKSLYTSQSPLWDEKAQTFTLAPYACGLYEIVG